MDLLIGLNAEQKKAVTHKDGPLLIVAGAGTGKTTVITRRLAYLVEKEFARTDEILALTFTDKAAGEMEERIDAILPYGYVDLWISTFHSFCQRILKDYGLEIGLDPDAKLLDETGQWMLIRKNLSSFNLDYYKPLGTPTKFIRTLTKHFGKLKDEAITPDEYLAYAEKLTLDSDSIKFIAKNDPEASGQEIARIQEIAHAYHMYQRLLVENGKLDFGDLINYTITLLQERPAIALELQKKFKYILVDEFQDTNWAQFELIKLLTGKKENITVVGDDDQSIYRFRGASVSNILQFRELYTNIEEVFLTTNYRSKQNILDLSYNFIQLNNPDRLEAKLKSKGLSKKLIAHQKGKGVIDYTEALDSEEEARNVTRKIIELVNTKKIASINEISVLVRSNEAAIVFMKAFADAKIDYQFLASRGLFGKPIIVDVISYFKLLDNYHESTALFRVLTTPYINFPEKELSTLVNLSRKKQWSLFETLQKYHGNIPLSNTSKSIIIKILKLIEKHTELSLKVFIQILIDLGIEKHLNDTNTYETYQQLWQLQQFFKEVATFSDTDDDPHLKEFMEYFSYLLESGEKGTLPTMGDEGPEAVSIMTIHSAKGLEFEHVFIPQLVDKRFPTIKKREAILIPEPLIRELLPEGDTHLQEERRLFYVACTRAKKGLYLSGAKNYGGTTIKKPSRFLVEIGLVKEEKSKPKIDLKKVLFNKESLPEKRLPQTWKPPLPKHFSFSQFRAYETCPYQYRFAFLLRIPAKGKAVFSFGQSMHTTLYQLFTTAKIRAHQTGATLFDDAKEKSRTLEKLVSWKEVRAMFESAWEDEWFDSQKEQTEYKERGISQLKKFYDVEQGIVNLPFALEEGFMLKVDKWQIKGAIDRIDINGDTVELIDYKTGKPQEKMSPLKEETLQLRMYQLALMQDKRFANKKFILSYYFLTNGKKVSFTIDETILRATEEHIKELCKTIEASDFTATPSPFVCGTCDFYDICQFRVEKK
jgi:DNA helicase II / ATP-dependent DNA helicase PcrA